MSDEHSVVVHSPDQRDVAVTATNPAQLPHLQQGLVDWARNRVEIAKRDAEEACAVYAEAVNAGFASKTLERLANRASKDLTYYEKLSAALEAGYVLIPSMACEVFAVRTKAQGRGGSKLYKGQWQVPDVQAQVLPQGQGTYVDNEPFVAQTLVDENETRWDASQGASVPTGKVVKAQRFYASDLDPEIHFPLIMAKPEIIRATKQAISLKLFDELGIVQDATQGSAGDPIIIGRIIKPGQPIRSARRVAFMVAWYVDTKAL